MREGGRELGKEKMEEEGGGKVITQKRDGNEVRP